MGEIERQIALAIAEEDAAPAGVPAAILLKVLAPGASEEDRYRHAVLQVHAVAALLQQHDIPGLLEAIDQADTLGPIIDPTTWNAKHGAMSEDKDALTAAYSLWLLGQRMVARRDG